MSGLVNDGMDKVSMMESEDRIEKTVDIYVSAEAVRDMKYKKDTEDFNTSKTQTPQHTGSDCVRIRSSRAALVCLVLLCVLLLTAVIVLCVHIHTKSTNYTEERDQLLNKISNITEERDQLTSKNENLTNERVQLIFKNKNLTNERDQIIFKNENLTNERDQLIFKNKNLTNERDQIIFKNENLTNERDQLIFKNKNLTNERDQLIFKNKNLTNERDQLIFKNENLTIERDQLIMKNKNLTNERDQLIFKNENLTNERDLRNELQICAGWTFYQSSLYYISNETKNWTESRRYCTERGADLIIINNREEHDFVKNISGAAVVWIGLTDIDVEKTWKWVDGSNMTSGFWAYKEPGGGREENCVVTVAVPISKDWQNLVGWHDAACNKAYQWICEKRIVQLLLP
ncbi:asialoglycoprotein receptor 1-like [Megalobrama amblycephala]|uniref:asialoglycoprotein receptor 1-like n=1 Tax=Megalobrama amblycephala TaxID=75352 RepID=UPI0020142FA3|nr:asialoglycoprotein receptor 1-like [Megalobrama amblycephala]